MENLTGAKKHCHSICLSNSRSKLIITICNNDKQNTQVLLLHITEMSWKGVGLVLYFRVLAENITIHFTLEYDISLWVFLIGCVYSPGRKCNTLM